MKENIVACVRIKTEDAKNLGNIQSLDVGVTTITGGMVERTTVLKIEAVGRLADQIPCMNHIERDGMKAASTDAIATETESVTTVTESRTMVGTSTIPIRLYCSLFNFLDLTIY